MRTNRGRFAPKVFLKLPHEQFLDYSARSCVVGNSGIFLNHLLVKPTRKEQMRNNYLLVLLKGDDTAKLEGWRRAFGSRVSIEAIAPRTWALTIKAGVR